MLVRESRAQCTDGLLPLTCTPCMSVYILPMYTLQSSSSPELGQDSSVVLGGGCASEMGDSVSCVGSGDGASRAENQERPPTTNSSQVWWNCKLGVKDGQVCFCVCVGSVFI